MTNGEWLMQHGYKFSDLVLNTIPNNGSAYDVYCNGKRVGQIENKTFGQKGRWNLLHWLDAEHVEPLLTEEQRAYLKDFIEPFKDDISAISYSLCSEPELEKYRLYIYVITDIPYDRDLVALPSCMDFEGLKKGKMYTIEELDL